MNACRWYALGVGVGLFALVSCTNDGPGGQSEKAPEATSGEQVDSLAWINQRIMDDPNEADLYLTKAQLLVRKGRWDDALGEVDRAIAVDSMQSGFYAYKADLFYQRKQMQQAALWARKALAKDETDKEANMTLAWIALITQNHDDVFVHANAVLEKDVNAAEAYFVKGQAYKETGNYRLAVTSFRTATEQDNEYYDAWVELGMLHALANDSLTPAYYDNAIRIDSTRYVAHYNKGYFLQESGQYEEALAAYDAIIRHHPSFYNAFYNKGFIYLEYLEEYEKSVEAFTKVVGINPLNYKAFYNRGLAYEAMEQPQQALEDFNRSLELKPDYDLAAKAKTRILEGS